MSLYNGIVRANYFLIGTDFLSPVFAILEYD